MSNRIPTPLRTFTNDRGKTFVVRILPAGAQYGRADKLVIDHAAVEFYDADYADDAPLNNSGDGFGHLGQFVNRYPYGTMIDHQGELILDGGVPPWRVDAATMKQVTTWLSTLDNVVRLTHKR